MNEVVKKGNGKLIYVPGPKEEIILKDLFDDPIYWLNDGLKEYLDKLFPFFETRRSLLHSKIFDEPVRDKDLISGNSSFQVISPSGQSILWRLYNLTQTQKFGEDGDLLVDGYPNIIGYSCFKEKDVSITANFIKTQMQWHCVLGPLNTWHRVKVFSV